MQYDIYYEVNDVSYGKNTRGSIFRDGQYYKPSRQAWICPLCLEVEVQVSVANKDSRVPRYNIVTNECESCGRGDILLAKTRITLPGSILMEGYNTIDELSVEMLRRELLLELKAMKLLIDKGVL